MEESIQYIIPMSDTTLNEVILTLLPESDGEVFAISALIRSLDTRQTNTELGSYIIDTGMSGDPTIIDEFLSKTGISPKLLVEHIRTAITGTATKEENY